MPEPIPPLREQGDILSDIDLQQAEILNVVQQNTFPPLVHGPVQAVNANHMTPNEANGANASVTNNTYSEGQSARSENDPEVQEAPAASPERARHNHTSTGHEACAAPEEKVRSCIICGQSYRQILFKPCLHFVKCCACCLHFSSCPVEGCGRDIREKMIWRMNVYDAVELLTPLDRTENANSSTTRNGDGMAENDRTTALMTCKECGLSNAVKYWTPCGHIVICSECTPSFKRCPYCKKPGRVGGTIQQDTEPPARGVSLQSQEQRQLKSLTSKKETGPSVAT